MKEVNTRSRAQWLTNLSCEAGAAATEANVESAGRVLFELSSCGWYGALAGVLEASGLGLAEGEGTRLSVAAGAIVKGGKRRVECVEGDRSVGSMGDAR